METPSLQITIKGAAACGKTTLALAIRDLLREHGVQTIIVVDDDLPSDGGHEGGDFNEQCLRDLAQKGLAVLVRTEMSRG